MKIAKINLARMQNNTHFQFHTEVRDRINEYDAEKLKIQEQYKNYLQLYDLEDEGVKKINKSAMTAQLQDASNARKKTWRGMVSTFSGALKHPDLEIQEAARRLKVVFDTYGDVTRKSLNAQTADIHQFLQELQGPYAADVEKIGITKWTLDLQQRNIAFDALKKKRADETTAKKSTVIHREARAALDEAYRFMTECIAVLRVLDGAPIYEDFIKTLNTIIKEYTSSMRRTKDEGESDSEIKEE